MNARSVYAHTQLQRRIFHILALAFIVALPLMRVALPGSAYADGSPTIVSDQSDYGPGDLVTLTGAGWQPGESVHLYVNDSVGNTWSWSEDVAAQADGSLTDSFNLPSWFVARYSATATGSSGDSATTSFTDSNVSVTFAGTGIGSSVSWAVNFNKYKDTSCTQANGAGSVPLTGTTAAAQSVGNSVGVEITGFTGTTGYTFQNLTKNLAATTYPLNTCISVTDGDTVTAHFTPAKTNPTFTFDLSSLPAVTYGDPSFSVASYASKPSGDTGAITFGTNPNSSVGCSVTSDGQVTITSAAIGTSKCVIDAWLAADSNYNAAGPIEQSFNIAQKPITVQASSPSDQTYGSSSAPTVSCTSSDFLNGDTFVTAPSGAVYDSTGTSPVTITSTSSAGTYVTKCSGGDPGSNYTISSYLPGSFTIDKKPITVVASSPPDQTYGSTTAPTVTCTSSDFLGTDTFVTSPTGAVYATAASTTPLTVTSATDAATYVTKCTGGDPGSNYTIAAYQNGSFTIDSAGTTTVYTGTQIWIQNQSGQTWALSAAVSPGVCQSTSNGTVVYTLDRNPLTGTAGSYDITNSTASDANTWQEGVYTLTATYTPTGNNCMASSDTATLTVGGSGDSANGGGWTTVNGAGRLNFGFTVQSVPNTSPTRYRGQFVMVNPGSWRVKGTLAGYTKSGTSGASSGTADVYSWNASTLSWQLVQSGVGFTISFTDNGSGAKKGTPDQFGQHISLSGPPSFSPQSLKGGNLTVR